jgi:hypothetical protein
MPDSLRHSSASLLKIVRSSVLWRLIQSACDAAIVRCLWARTRSAVDFPVRWRSRAVPSAPRSWARGQQWRVCRPGMLLVRGLLGAGRRVRVGSCRGWRRTRDHVRRCRRSRAPPSTAGLCPASGRCWQGCRDVTLERAGPPIWSAAPTLDTRARRSHIHHMMTSSADELLGDDVR